MSDTIILQASCKFRKIEWDSVVKDQKIFYHLKTRRKVEEAHGPFVVVETGIVRLKDLRAIKFRNQQNYEFSLSEEAIQLLEFVEVV
jgi:hypothetical protein